MFLYGNCYERINTVLFGKDEEKLLLGNADMILCYDKYHACRIGQEIIKTLSLDKTISIAESVDTVINLLHDYYLWGDIGMRYLLQDLLNDILYGKDKYANLDYDYVFSVLINQANNKMKNNKEWVVLENQADNCWFIADVSENKHDIVRCSTKEEAFRLAYNRVKEEENIFKGR